MVYVPSAYYKESLKADYNILIQISAAMDVSSVICKKSNVISIVELALEVEESNYKLKQSGRLWNELLVSTLTKLGFEQFFTDSYMFYKVDGLETVPVGM